MTILCFWQRQADVLIASACPLLPAPFIGKYIQRLLLIGCICALSASTLSAQCALVCRSGRTISLDTTCSYTLQPSDLLSGTPACPAANLRAEMQIGGRWWPAVLDATVLNQTLTVRVRDVVSNSTCPGSITVQDLMAPRLRCDTLVVPCLIQDRTPENLDRLGIRGAWPTVLENCSNVTRRYSDAIQNIACDLSATRDYSAVIRRTWSVTDASNNLSTCVQIIYLERRHTNSVQAPPNVTLTCINDGTAPAQTGFPFVMLYNQKFNLSTERGICDLSSTFTDERLPLCKGSYSILRRWTIFDWCFGGSPNPARFIQIIKVEDDIAPTMTCPANLTVSTDVNVCRRNLKLPDVVIDDACSSIKSAYAERVPEDEEELPVRIPATLSTFPNNNLKKPDTLAVMGTIPGLLVGTAQIRYVAIDDCDNLRSCTFTVTVVDKVAPTPICNTFQTISLGTDGRVQVPAASFNRGSTDNCGSIALKVRRNKANTCQSEKFFFDAIQLCCDDAGDTIEVTLRIFDGAVPPDTLKRDDDDLPNYSDCVVRVFVADKLPPTCTPPPAVTVRCVDFDPSLSSYGTAQGRDNCCFKGITTSVDKSNFDSACQRGTIIRSFRASDCTGLSAVCTQRITVNYEQNYFIRFPDDVIVTSCTADNTDYGKPVFFGKDCELLAISSRDNILTAVPGACQMIERTWRIINGCTYSPNLNCVVIPNPNPDIRPDAPANLRGVVISASGTTGEWAATIDKINPTDVALTIFSQFWRSDANCFEYKQLIRIIDQQAPVAACPTAPQVVSDTTLNNPALWHAPVWKDVIRNVADLADAPVELCLSATDACAGANLTFRYLLQLDLDGDGTQETTVQSNAIVPPPAGSVYYNNAGQTNPTGGTLRLFDNRNVPADQKYQFSISYRTDGRNRTACVRWNNNAAPEAFISPQLPHGRHSIRWVVGDGCGNETTCNYTFTIQDGKTLANVPLNGRVVLGKDSTKGLSNVRIRINNANTNFTRTITTDSSGNFRFAAIPAAGGTYTIRPAKNDDPLNGVNTFDIALISKHLLNIQTIEDPLILIAADINRSGGITNFDIVELRKLILGIYDSLPANQSWRFIDRNHVFKNRQNPFDELMPETISVSNLPANGINNVRFLAIKIGDIDNTAGANGFRMAPNTSGTLSLPEPPKQKRPGSTKPPDRSVLKE
jgi:Carboxypeptidase regulatory-like domain